MIQFAETEWTADFRAAIVHTFHDELGARRMERGVTKRDLQAWQVAINGNKVGALITEKLPGEIFVWCYEGRDFFAVSQALAKFAIFNGMSQIGWFTFHKGAARRYRRYAPKIDTTGIPGEMRFRLNAEKLANGV